MRIIVFTFFVVMLSSCAVSKTGAPTEVIAFRESLRHHIGSTSIFVGQDPNNSSNMFTYYGASGQQFGLLGAIIESALASSAESDRQKREAAFVPIRHSIITYNFGSKLRAAVQSNFSELQWLNVKEARKEPVFQAGMYEQLKNHTSSDAILVVDSYYRMSDDLMNLQVSADVVMFANNANLIKSAGLKPEAPILYNNKFTVQISNPTVEDAHTSWLSNDAVMLYKAFDYANAVIVNTISDDLNNRYSRYKESPLTWIVIDNTEHDVHLVSKDQKSKVARNASGEYFVVSDLNECCQYAGRSK